MNNRQLDLAPDCSVRLSGDPAPRFEDGQRALLFLEPDDLGVAAWRPAGLSFAEFGVSPGGVLYTPGQRLSLADVLPQLEALSAVPYDPGFEPGGECSPPWFSPRFIETYGRMSEAVVIGTFHDVPGQPGVARLDLERAFKGGEARSLDVDLRWDPPDSSCLPGEQPPSDPGVDGLRALVFLVRVDPGAGIWRPAVRGQGIALLDGDYVASFAPYSTVGSIRQALAEGPAFEPPLAWTVIAASAQETPDAESPPSDGDPGEDEDTGDGSYDLAEFAGLSVVVLVVAVVVFVVARRRAAS
ncbi:MAG: hypothetical protein ACM3S1_02705 [Hyphomicrobiales bacterium]